MYNTKDFARKGGKIIQKDILNCKKWNIFPL